MYLPSPARTPKKKELTEKTKKLNRQIAKALFDREVKKASMRKKTTVSVGTQTKGRSTGPGKSGGFLAGKKYGKKYTKKSIKVGRTGVQLNSEIGFVATATEVINVGHCTHPEDYVFYAISMALVKYMFSKHNYQCGGDLTAQLSVVGSNGYSVGDVFRVFIKDDTAGTNSITTILTVAAGSTVGDLVTNLKTTLIGIYGNENTRLTSFGFIPATTAPPNTGMGKDRLDLNLSGAKFKIRAKSSLKLQNRSILSGDTSIDDVDNQPLHGKFYECKGTYLRSRKVDGLRFCASRLHGHIAYGINRGGTWEIREPPEVSYFNNVKRSGKAKIDPGELKTSVLDHTESCSIDKLHRYCEVGVGALSSTTGGKLRMFALEKMLDAESVAQNLTIACELDYKIFVTMTNKNQDYWAAYNLTKEFPVFPYV